ncbi:hypothetical protein GCM10023171_36620 [Microbacterium panaciterrae]|uniref:Uncharacterized protein n=2 Tax=Microbacterium panaciterrae TaxID=985759 RepID=A0ABP8PV62_9MICO
MHELNRRSLLTAAVAGASFFVASSAIATPAYALAGRRVPATATTGVAVTESADAAGFAHPGVGVSAASLRTARDMVASRVEPWATYYDAMVQTPYASRTLRSKNGTKVVDQPGHPYFNSSGIQSKFIEDAFGAYTQAILYVLTGDAVFRENGMRILRIWSHLDPQQYAVYPDAHIHTGVPLYRMVAAAEIFRSTDFPEGYTSYDIAWSDQDSADFTRNLIVPVTDTFNYGNTWYLNQHTYPLIGTIAGYIFTGNRARYDEAVEWFTVNATTTKPEQNGAVAAIFPLIAADDPINTYGHAFVQHQEMGRDQAHGWDDINTVGTLARLLGVQGTRVDPVHGTVSTSEGSVTAYEFLDHRILKAADAFTSYMLGYTVPWVDTAGHGGVLSQAYRGRLFNPIDELYTVYRYTLGLDMTMEALHLQELHDKSDGPLFYWGTAPYNSWNSNPDYAPEFWLSLPAALAGQTRPVAADDRIHFATRSAAVDGGPFTVITENGTEYLQVNPPHNGRTLAVRTLLYAKTTGFSPVGIRLRTRGPARIAVGQDPAKALEVLVPDTGGQWRYVAFDTDPDALFGIDLGGDNLAYLHFSADNARPIDLDHIDLNTKTDLALPQFPAGTKLSVIGIAGSPLQRSLAAEYPGPGRLTYSATGLPRGAVLDASSGQLSWVPDAGAVGTHTFPVVADDGTSVVVHTTVVVVADGRDAAMQAALSGYDSDAAYVSSTVAALNGARSSAEAAAASADDGAFLGALLQVQTAVAGLQLLTPRLDSDHSVDYRGIVSTYPTSVQARAILDDNFATYTGDLRAPFTLDFGPGFLIAPDAFGIRARFGFANRSQGANVYGSADGSTWTLLTSRMTTDTTDLGYPMENIPVRDDVKGQRYRLFRIQVDAPGVPTDPAYPGISSFSEVHIFGIRSERAQ